MEFRVEYDSVGEKKVPKEAYYGVQSLRGYENFRITNRVMSKEFIDSLAEVKKACAITNNEVNEMTDEIKNAIVEACDEIINGKLHDQFIVDPIQGGAGTSANMNVNEVVANRAGEILGGTKGAYDKVHPNDHVNMGQSTNDVIPTAGKLTTIKLLNALIAKTKELVVALDKKSAEFNDVIKMGRTQMQDAVPIRLGQEFKAYSSAIKRDVKRLENVKKELLVSNMGGTAIGTGINADEVYFKNIVKNLNKVTGYDFEQAEDLVDSTQNLDIFVSVSSTLKILAVTLSKMSNDLRLMSSGPRTGFGEINLPAKQNGSSIMPGKVNPVIPEVVSQVAFNVIGNDMTIAMAAEAGQLELNAFEPVIFYNLFESIETLNHGMDTLIVNCINGIEANRERCKDMVENSVGIITAICPHVGYKESAKIAKRALKTGDSVRKIALSENILTEKQLNKILEPMEMTEPGIAGKEFLTK